MLNELTGAEKEKAKEIAAKMKAHSKSVYMVNEKESEDPVLLSLVHKENKRLLSALHADGRLYAVFMNEQQQAAFLDQAF